MQTLTVCFFTKHILTRLGKEPKITSQNNRIDVKVEQFTFHTGNILSMTEKTEKFQHYDNLLG